MTLPTAIKKQKASLNVTRANKNEIEPLNPISEIPLTPETLGAKGASEWVKIWEFLTAHKMCDSVDESLIEMYCMEMETYYNYKARIAKEGATILNHMGVETLHPLTVAASTAYKNAKSMAVEYGFTANSRGKMNVQKPKETKSKMAILKGSMTNQKVG